MHAASKITGVHSVAFRSQKKIRKLRYRKETAQCRNNSNCPGELRKTTMAVQKTSKVANFRTNRKHIWNFPLVATLVRFELVTKKINSIHNINLHVSSIYLSIFNAAYKQRPLTSRFQRQQRENTAV